MEMTKRWFLLLLVFTLSVPLLHAEEELLEPDKAFAFSASMVGDKVQLQWDVADGYYLYKDKIRLSSATTGIKLGEPQLPAGKLKKDEFFGELEVYRHRIKGSAPVIREDNSLDTFQLIAKYQGCADIGVCYPPITKTLTLKLPKLAAATAVDSIAALGSSIGLGASDEDEILEPDQAFNFSLDVEDPNTLLARWQIAPDHYMYRDKIKFSLTSPDARLGNIALPKGEEKHDEFFGDIEVYHNTVEARIPVIRSSGDPLTVTLDAVYQGCAEKTGICYPPIKKKLTLDLPASNQVVNVLPASEAAPLAPEHPLVSEQDRIAASLTSGSTLLVIAMFFGFGLLLAFTPCVFPMIPILSSIIVGQGENLTTRRAFIMSMTYVLAMALTYTVAGVIAGMVGQNIQAVFQSPWVLGSFAAVFVLLSLSMFGFYDLQLPSALQSKLTEVSNKQQGGSLIGVAIMGFLSALIVGPCVAAPLAGALIYIGQTGDAVLGGVALFALSMGMGAPLVAIGTSAGKLLPRAGSWMDAIKAVFGVMLLAVAIWMLERVLPVAVIMLMWATLLIISAIYMKALDPLPADSSGWAKFWKGVGVILLLIGALQIVGALSGGKDYMQPLKGMGGGGSAAEQQHLSFKPVKTVADLQREIDSAKSQGKFVMLDFYADWCIYCKDFEKYVFTDPRVQKKLANVVLLQADVTDNDDADQALLKHVKVTAPPAILFFDKSGNEMRGYRLVGSKTADEFLAHLNQALK